MIDAGEMPACLDELAQLHVQALDHIGCVDRPPVARRKREVRRDLLPGALPGPFRPSTTAIGMS